MMGAKSKLKSCVVIGVYMGALLWGAIVPLQVLAATNKFLLIEGVKGDSTDARHPGWSDVVTYGQTLTEPNGKNPKCQSVVTKMIDSASPVLWNKTVAGEALLKVTLEILAAGSQGSQRTEFRSMLHNVKISRIVNQEGTDTSLAADMETITLLPQMITFEVIRVNQDGSSLPPVRAEVMCPQNR
jgi:type VI protein secretion system component Hcp